MNLRPMMNACASPSGFAFCGMSSATVRPVGSPADEGYVPTGRRVFEVAEQPAPLRAVEMLLRKVRGEPYTTEWPVPRYHRVPAAPPLGDLAKATIALVTTGGLVPAGGFAAGGRVPRKHKARG